MDWPSFGVGAFAATVVLGASEWLLYHFLPMDRTRDARDLARRKMKHTKR